MEYRLLLAFLKNPGQVFTRARLLEEIWDVAGDFVNDNTLTVYVKRLREKLEDDIQNPRIIQTVRGLGYRCLLYTSKRKISGAGLDLFTMVPDTNWSNQPVMSARSR